MKKTSKKIAILGAGLTGCCAALNLANQGVEVKLFDRLPLPVSATSLHNEGKLHLGYVYALDKQEKTHIKLIEGALQFLGILEYLTGIEQSNFRQSSTFNYAVLKTTMLPLHQVMGHFERVDTAAKNFLAEGTRFTSSQSIPPVKLLKKVDEKNYNMSALEGVIQTPEFAVNTVQIANLVGAAVLSHDHIDFKGKCEIEAVEQTADGAYQIGYLDGNKESKAKFDACINCLWEDRIKMDKQLGKHPVKPCLTRYKATITFVNENESFSKIPNTTLVVGPFGDVVNYQDGRFYFSWYPACKIGESSTADFRDLKTKADQLDRKQIIRESMLELSHYLPSLEQFTRIADTGNVGGGFVCGWGETDITDVDSGLHNRSEIGVEVHDRWLSVNTGKFCTAPLYGLHASDQLLPLL